MNAEIIPKMLKLLVLEREEEKLERTRAEMKNTNRGTQHLWIVNPVKEGKEGGPKEGGPEEDTLQEVPSDPCLARSRADPSVPGLISDWARNGCGGWWGPWTKAWHRTTCRIAPSMSYTRCRWHLASPMRWCHMLPFPLRQTAPGMPCAAQHLLAWHVTWHLTCRFLCGT